MFKQLVHYLVPWIFGGPHITQLMTDKTPFYCLLSWTMLGTMLFGSFGQQVKLGLPEVYWRVTCVRAC